MDDLARWMEGASDPGADDSAEEPARRVEEGPLAALRATWAEEDAARAARGGSPTARRRRLRRILVLAAVPWLLVLAAALLRAPTREAPGTDAAAAADGDVQATTRPGAQPDDDGDPEAGSDAGDGSGPDAGSDAGDGSDSDAGRDAGDDGDPESDAGRDAGDDGDPDSGDGRDAGDDGDPDSGDGRDAGDGSDPDAGIDAGVEGGVGTAADPAAGPAAVGGTSEAVLAAAATVAIRSSLEAPAGRRRQVDLAIPEAVEDVGGAWVVRVAAVVLEGPVDGAWEEATPVRLAVPLREHGGVVEVVGAPWALPLPLVRGTSVAFDLTPPEDDGAVRTGLTAAGYLVDEVRAIGGAPTLPDVVAAVVVGVAPGEAAPREHVVWLVRDGDGLAVAGAPEVDG